MRTRKTIGLQYMDFIPAFREQVSCYGEDRFALPCGASALVLAYRRDAFENDANRAAARAAGLELKPPKTWSELDALARFFEGRDWSGSGKPEHGIVLAMGADPEGNRRHARSWRGRPAWVSIATIFHSCSIRMPSRRGSTRPRSSRH